MNFPSLYKLLFLIFATLYAGPASAQNSFDLFGGFALSSKLQDETSIDIALTPAGFQYNRFLKNWDTFVGFTSIISSANYTIADTTKTGLFYSVGGTLSRVFVETKHARFGWSLGFYPYSVLAVASQAKVTVNDEVIKHSSVTSFTGNQGFGAKVGAYYPGKKAAKYRLGSELEYMQHKFTRQSTKTVSSNSDLAPGTDSVEEAHGTLSVMSLLFVAGFTI
jgi:hypothetical protein